MTLVASAMSIGAFAQADGYYRVVNVGYYLHQKVGVVNVSSAVTAQPDADKAAAKTLAGTVMYITTEASDLNPVEDPYIIVTKNDRKVINLRSQAVDANVAIYTPMVKKIKDLLELAIGDQNRRAKWGLEKEDISSIIEEMFSHMDMYLEPVEYTNADMDGDFKADGQYFYLKSTTPRLIPLVKALKEKGIEIDEYAVWNRIVPDAKQYFSDNGMTQELAEWEFFTDRIHLGHTYYLIGGRVVYKDDKFKDAPDADQKHNAGDTPFISFANNNTLDYTYIEPERQVADDYAIWKLVPVDAINNPFVVKGDSKVTGKRDEKYYLTGYFDFPFEPVDKVNVKVWGISDVKAPKAFKSIDNGETKVVYVQPSPYDIAPAKTPVVIESVEESAILLPKGVPADKGEVSVMKGVFFDTEFDTKGGAKEDEEFDYYAFPTDQFMVNKIEGAVKILRKNFRAFYKTNSTFYENNPIGFFKYSGSKVKANKGWIDMADITVPEEEAEDANVVIVDAATFAALTDGITEVNKAEKSSNVVYDIQGRIVTNPTKGLYIVNGKKVIK